MNRIFLYLLGIPLLVGGGIAIQMGASPALAGIVVLALLGVLAIVVATTSRAARRNSIRVDGENS